MEYDGTRYKGFQLQAGQPTIQGEIESSLTKFTGESTRIRGASRTDSGAHAKGQVVDFLTGSHHAVDVFPRALNYYLPDDIEVQWASQVPVGFNSRRNASSRIYQYNILNRPWPSPLTRHTHYWVREELDVARMAESAQGLVGLHDFRPLATGHPLDQSAVREVYRWEVWKESDTLIIECEANGFLKHQIRKANALLVGVGRGQYPVTITKDVLKVGAGVPVQAAGLPSHGLCLIKVRYPDPIGEIDRPTESTGVSTGAPGISPETDILSRMQEP